MIFSRFVICFLVLSSSCTMKSKEEFNQVSSYVDLEKLFLDWRNFENPPLLNGAPDYTKSQFKKSQNTFNSLGSNTSAEENDRVLEKLSLDP